MGLKEYYQWLRDLRAEGYLDVEITRARAHAACARGAKEIARYTPTGACIVVYEARDGSFYVQDTVISRNAAHGSTSWTRVDRVQV